MEGCIYESIGDLFVGVIKEGDSIFAHDDSFYCSWCGENINWKGPYSIHYKAKHEALYTFFRLKSPEKTVITYIDKMDIKGYKVLIRNKTEAEKWQD